MVVGLAAACSIGVAPIDHGFALEEAGEGDVSEASTGAGDATGQADESTASNSNLPHCRDAMVNFDETDVDCGGRDCLGCELGRQCRIPDDCRSKVCESGICSPPDCADDTDCENLDEACRSGVCDLALGRCDQQDLPDTTPCETDNFCEVGGQCLSGACVATDRDCSQLDGPCVAGVCDSVTQSCITRMLDDGTACDDQDACTQPDTCRSGVCSGQTSATIFAESFTQPDPGWSMTTIPAGSPSGWEIGPAMSSRDCPIGIDPSVDASADGSLALAGVVIGGCAPLEPTSIWDCLTSPSVPVDDSETVIVQYQRHLGSDLYQSDSDTGVLNRVEVQLDQQWSAKEEGFATFTVDEAWLARRLVIDTLGAQSMRIRFCYSNRQNGAGAAYAGWSVDEVRFTDARCQ